MLGELKRVYKAGLEQYPTPTHVAAHLVWITSLKGAIKGLTVSDFGCGNGILAVASLIAGSSRAICVEIDEELVTQATEMVTEYYREVLHKVIFVVGDATSIELNNVDTVIMNPPFGVSRRRRGVDLAFLENALKNAHNVYSIHKYSEGFFRAVEKRLRGKFNFVVKWLEVLNLEIPMIYERHRRRVYRIKALLLGLTKY